MQTEPLYPSATLPLRELRENRDDYSVASGPTVPLVHTTVSAPLPHLLLGPENTVTTCPFCHASIKTAVKYTTTTRTHIAAVLYGLMCCCCCIGYCSDSAKNSDHYCPNCQRFLGTYQK
ncbi:LITAF-like zinc ribbon domain-containing protein [Phthorimaea operculella]|nr:LITAF-like zinc ribbon domain-containing protein [Phthorimaea operculella]